MKREDLFEGAIVLARSSAYDRRSRWKVLEVRDTIVKVKKDNISMYTGFKHLRPAKITPKSLEELGFEKTIKGCPAGRRLFCIKYKYPNQENTWVVFKKDCNLWRSTVIFRRGTHTVSYIHEVQKILNNQQS